MIRHVFRVVSLISVALLVPEECAAEFRYCNETAYRLYTAFGYYEEGQWTSKGWWPLEPDECATVYAGPLTRRKYYTHAHLSANTRVWGGDYVFCTQTSAFTIRGDKNCRDRGFGEVGFSEVDVGEARDWTTRFTCPDCPSVDPEAFRLDVTGMPVRWTLDGRDVTMMARGTVTLKLEGSQLIARLDAIGDLSSLQSVLPSIVQARLNHNDDCDYVLNVHTVRARASGADALLFGAAHYEEWECPDIAGISLGKHRLFEQNGDVTVRIRPRIVNDDLVVTSNLEGVSADGVLGNLLGSDVFGPWIWDALDDLIPSTLRIATLRELYPPQLRAYRPRLYAVGFKDLGGGRLGLSAKAIVSVSGPQARDLLASIMGR